MEKSHADADKWDRIYAKATDQPIVACRMLREFSFLLPVSGHALDVACGRGGNALLLAEHGLQTTALDISRTALRGLGVLAKSRELSIELNEADTANFSANSESFDVIVVSNYLDRDVC